MKKTEARLHELGLPPDIIDIARNHRDLSPKARERVLASIQEYNEEIASLREEISKLEIPKAWYTREELRASIFEDETKIHACRSLLTVMRRMPLETMGEIFEYCLLPGGDLTLYRGDSDDEDSDSEGGTVTTAGLLCLVCKYWKTVATATPALWSDIHVKALQYHRNASPLVDASHVRAIWAWMERVSYPWRLSIDIIQSPSNQQVEGNDDTIGGVPLHQVLNRPASLHLQRLAITGTADVWTLEMGEISFPRVTSIVYNCTTWYISRPAASVGFPSIPNVTRAAINNIFILKDINPNILVPPEVPWSRLTHLSLGGELELYRWRSVFKHCTALQKACFRLSHNEGDANYPQPAEANFPDLTELVFMHSSPFQEPFLGVSTPALTKLRMYTNWGEPGMDFSNPGLFGNLTHLSLICCAWVTDELMLNILKNIPQLEELFFTLAYGFKVILEFLTYGHDGKFALRRLEALGIIIHTTNPTSEEVDGAALLPFPMDALVDMAASRTQAVKDGRFSSVPYTFTPLQNLVVRLDVHWADVKVRNIREALAPLASYGLKTSVYGSWEGRNAAGSLYLGGNVPPPPMGEKHWDEGLMGFLDDIEEYSLFPKDDPLL